MPACPASLGNPRAVCSLNVPTEPTALRTLAGAVANTLYDAIRQAAGSDELDDLVRLLWRGYGEGAVCDEDAQFLQSYVDRRRPAGRMVPVGHLKSLPGGRMVARLGRFTPRQRPRSPDRKASRDRRRMLGGSSALPDNLRHHYTEGQRAVLCIVAGEVKLRGICDLPIDKIAALAGVCRTTVQTAMHEARRLGHIKITERPVPGRKSLPNIVEVVSREWMTWLRRGPSAARLIGSKPLNLVNTTKNKKRKIEVVDEEKTDGSHTTVTRQPDPHRRWAS
jgi:hypothetical protein